MTKYSGAGWLQRSLGPSRSLGPFGTRVANVLGQVYRGIYHIDSAVLKKGMFWDEPWVLPVNVSGGLATFDFDELTRLVFCCQQAGIGVDICGCPWAYTKLLFSAKRPTIGQIFQSKADGILSPNSCDPEGDFLAFANKMLSVRDGGKVLWVTDRSQAYSVDAVEWQPLQLLVNECHQHSIRASLTGRSSHSLEAVFSQRSNEPGLSTYDRHPTLEQHRKELERIINIDYESFE